nr:MAG TPA: hypothetical protein [Caudoviricetes sp.]
MPRLHPGSDCSWPCFHPSFIPPFNARSRLNIEKAWEPSQKERFPRRFLTASTP